MLTDNQVKEVEAVCQEMIDNMSKGDLINCLKEDPEFSEDGLLTNDAFGEMPSAPQDWDDEFTNDVIRCAYNYFGEHGIDVIDSYNNDEPGNWINSLLK